MENTNDEAVVESLEEENMFEEGKCVWVGEGCTEHDGEVKQRDVFGEAVKMFLCERHHEEHMNVMILASADLDIEDVLDMTTEEREEKVKIMKENGLLSPEHYKG